MDGFTGIIMQVSVQIVLNWNYQLELSLAILMRFCNIQYIYMAWLIYDLNDTNVSVKYDSGKGQRGGMVL